MTEPDCACLDDLLCCGCGLVTIRQVDGHVLHDECSPKPRPVVEAEMESASPDDLDECGPDVADIPPEEREKLNKEADEQGVPF